MDDATQEMADAAPEEPRQVELRDAEGRITFQGQVVDGMLRGEGVEWWPKGKVAQRATMVDGRLDGELRRYAENGSLVLVAQYRAGAQHGLTVCYDSQRPLCRMSYRQGVLDGDSVYYAPTGKVSAVIPFKEGRMHGIATYFTTEGAVLRTAAYADDRQEGPSVTYYENGAVQETATYKAGLLEGRFERFFPSGRPMQQGAYRAGLLVEPLRSLDEQGRVIAEIPPGAAG
ncbi:toxin-antitoxin system YwqK family antitoxin [Arenibaculum pallidiluteum]|uniref:toxin-antitoxin system YwqK family antitoxin n=1 Tax=Arenibaculum pallidiluteum TaxID=2812559 RepID=UPI001A97A723|nr:toxin-antitoxin system YwqK family antitoxin [Arenibaculum pallidiluteum]